MPDKSRRVKLNSKCKLSFVPPPATLAAHFVTDQAARIRTRRVSAMGAALTVLCGLVLWLTPPGDFWVNASYDYLFRFGSHAVTNQVTLILMDNAAFDQFHQTRGQPWDRALHAQLLNRLADDGCALVVMDSFFRERTIRPKTRRSPPPCAASATSS